MNFQNVHHLREVLVTDEQGKPDGTMQYSSQSISRFRPSFTDIPYNAQATARELYVRLGGKRREGMRIGTAVTLDLAELTGMSESPAQEKAAALFQPRRMASRTTGGENNFPIVP